MCAIVRLFEHSLALPFFGNGMKAPHAVFLGSPNPRGLCQLGSFSLTVFNVFIKAYFTCYKIHPFQVYNSWVLQNICIWPHWILVVACGTWPGIEPRPSALEQSPCHWTTREVPTVTGFFIALPSSITVTTVRTFSSSQRDVVPSKQALTVSPPPGPGNHWLLSVDLPSLDVSYKCSRHQHLIPF